MKINVLSKTTCGCTVFSTLVFTLGISAESLATTIAYTNDADFDLGVLNSVNYTSPNSNQLQLSAIGETFPILWVANAGEDSVSKIDTDNDCEDARYSTWFESTFHGAYSGPAPSRTAVDVEGNVLMVNPPV